MLFLPIGPPGSGKSTLCDWALDNNIITFDAVVSPDDIRLWITGDRARQDRNPEVFKIVDIAVYSRLQLGLDVWLDATNMPARDFHSPHDKLVRIVFDTPEDVLWQRNTTRDNPVPEVVLEQMISRFKDWKTNHSSEDFVTPEEFKKGFIG